MSVIDRNQSIVIFNVAICGLDPTANSRPLSCAAAAWVWSGPVPHGAQSLCAPAATEAALSAKTTRAMMTRRRSLAIALKGEREGVDWPVVEVLALGSCSGAR
jgi:hypothetical protein